LSTYQNQSVPSFDNGICKAYSENYRFVGSKYMMQGRWPQKLSHTSITSYTLLPLLTSD
jgi:hypothetical protein